MNATSLYVSTSRLVFQNDYTSDQNWMDLYRLVPYLRQSLSCTVCGNLLIEPQTPTEGHCQHHVCKMCVKGRKNLKPACNWCKDYDKYEENMTLRILLQCYKSLCEHIMNTPIYNMICKQTKASGVLNNGTTIPCVSLVEFIEEGAKFQDVFKANSGLTKSAYSILPCVFNPCPPPNNINNVNVNLSSCAQSQPQQQQHQQHQHQQQQHQQPHHQQQQQFQLQHQHQSQNTTNNSIILSSSNNEQLQHKTTPISHLPPIKTVSNGSAMYSVLYTGIGNKITIKRKTNGDEDFNNRKFQQQQMIRPKPISKRRGCRCGNATATPGKLTCCGQRCPCYVDQKSCIDCKCRGCRNPHRPDGGKIRPHIPELACYEIQVADDSTPNLTTTLSSSNNSSSNSSGIVNRTTNRVEIPLEEFGARSRLTPTKSITNINSTFDGNSHQLRQPLTLENVTRESLLISSPEGNFQVLNVFTSPPQGTTIGSHHSQLHTARNNSHHQIQEISTTLPQILLQKQEPVSLLATGHRNQHHHRPHHHHHHQTVVTSLSGTTASLRPATITTLSSGPSNTITLSPIIVSTNSNPFPTQIFSEEEIITTQCSPSPTQPPPLIEITASDHIN